MTDIETIKEVGRWLPLILAGFLIFYGGELLVILALLVLQVIWIGVPWVARQAGVKYAEATGD